MAAKGQLTNLSDEVLFMLLKEYCDDVSLFMLARTCKYLRDFIVPEVRAGRLGTGKKRSDYDEWLPERKWEFARKVAVYPWWVREAVRAGSVAILEWAAASDPKKWDFIYWCSVEHVSREFSPRDELMKYAAQSGNLDSLKAVHRLTRIRLTNKKTCADISYAAAESGSVECLRWLHEEKNCPWKYNTCNAAASSGVLAALVYLLENDAMWDCDIIDFAGSAAVLKFCCSNARELTELLSPLAASRGNLEVLQAALNGGMEWHGKTTCRHAAECGQLECLRWAHEAGAPWDAETVRRAAKNGFVECVRYTVDNGCPYDLEKCLEACQEDPCSGPFRASVLDPERIRERQKVCLAYLETLQPYQAD